MYTNREAELTSELMDDVAAYVADLVANGDWIEFHEFEPGETPEENCVQYKNGCTFWRFNDGNCVAEVRDVNDS